MTDRKRLCFNKRYKLYKQINGVVNKNAYVRTFAKVLNNGSELKCKGRIRN